MLERFSALSDCTVVLCTAAQPAWTRRDDLSEGLRGVREIVPASLDLFPRLKRVSVEWPLRPEVRREWNELAEGMLQERAALCVVNTRSSARQLFRSAEGDRPPDRWYRAGIAVLEQDSLAVGHRPDVGDPDAIQEYFRRLYKSGELDENDIQGRRNKLNFAEVGALYRLIDQDTVPVVVGTWEPHRGEVDTLLAQWRTDPKRSLLRSLSPYQVNLRSYELRRGAQMIAEAAGGLRVWWGSYDGDLGLLLNDESDLPPV